MVRQVPEGEESQTSIILKAVGWKASPLHVALLLHADVYTAPAQPKQKSMEPMQHVHLEIIPDLPYPIPGHCIKIRGCQGPLMRQAFECHASRDGITEGTYALH